MPIYSYRCLNCGNTFEVVAPMSECDKRKKCSCGKLAYRDLAADHNGGTVDSQNRDYQFEGDTGTRMYAAAYMKGQETEMKEKHPGRDFKWHNSCWLPVIKNRQDKKKFLKERGYVEF